MGQKIKFNQEVFDYIYCTSSIFESKDGEKVFLNFQALKKTGDDLVLEEVKLSELPKEIKEKIISQLLT